MPTSLPRRFAAALAQPTETTVSNADLVKDEGSAVLSVALVRISELQGEVTEAREAEAAALELAEAAASDTLTAARAAGELVAAAEANKRVAMAERDAARAAAAAADAQVAHAEAVVAGTLAAAEVVIVERDAARAQVAAALGRATRAEAHLAAAAGTALAAVLAGNSVVQPTTDAHAQVLLGGGLTVMRMRNGPSDHASDAARGEIIEHFVQVECRSG